MVIKHANFLPQEYLTKAEWASLTDAMDKVLNTTVYSPLNDLRNVRNPYNLTREYLIRALSSFGFNYRNDLLSDKDYQRFMQYKRLYDPSSGTKATIDFLGFIKNSKFLSYQLWSSGEDYSGGFQRNAGGSTILSVPTLGNENIALWYPTSHFELVYDAERYPIDETDLGDLFYQFSPIHLVLKYITRGFFPDASNIYLNNLLYEHTYDNGYLVIPPDNLGLLLAILTHIHSGLNTFAETIGEGKAINTLYCMSTSLDEYYNSINLGDIESSMTGIGSIGLSTSTYYDYAEAEFPDIYSTQVTGVINPVFGMWTGKELISGN